MSEQACDHRFVFLESLLERHEAGWHQWDYHRTDVFFCERCLERKEQKQSAHGEKAPPWYQPSRRFGE